MSATQAVTQAGAAAVTPAFEPRITAFVCKWCTYAGADLAGTSRTQYPPNVRALKLPCTGRIDIVFVVRAFLQGADGVLVSGCHPGDCHYNAGNYRARRRWVLLRDLLDAVGFDLRRFDCAWISAAEGNKWARTVKEFTEKIKALGPYQEMRALAGQTPEPVPTLLSDFVKPELPETVPAPQPELTAAIREALASGKVKAVVGWALAPTLGRCRPYWITAADEADKLVPPGDLAPNLARLLKNSQLKPFRPLGLVARASEVRALNVLRQEAQLALQDAVVFAIGPDGKFTGTLDADAAAKTLTVERPEEPAGFKPELLKQLDALLARPREERWAFWQDQFSRCLKCYACRGSCPLCGCDQCLADRNQPQWWPTAADPAGNFAWHVVRAFHLAGRCVGCGACQAACPTGVAVNLLGAAAARSALKHFGHRAGSDPSAVPLQSDFKPDDKESFIL